MNKKLGTIFSKCYLLLILLLIYTPIAVMIIFSFSGSGRFSFAGGASFDGYKAIFSSSGSGRLFDALRNTLLIAAVSSLTATLIGSFSTVGIFYLGRRTKKAVLSVNQLPLINSEIVMAVSLMLFFITLGIPLGYITLFISHVAFCTPYVILSILPRLQRMDPNMYEAALDLGANPMKAMVRVMLPYIAPGILSGFVMSFTLSMDDFIITQMNKGSTSGIDTLSTLLYQDARVGGLEPYWFPVFTVIFLIVLTTVLTVNFFRSRKEPAAQKH